MHFGACLAALKIGFISSPECQTKLVSRARYASKSSIGRVATPESIAAFATAGAIITMSRGSNGFGIRYSGPNRRFSWRLYAVATMSDCSIVARSASARTQASFIASLIAVAPRCLRDVGHDFRLRIGKRQDQRLVGHRREPFGLQHAPGGEPEKDIGA